MTAPRQVIAGKCYLVTKRVAQQLFRLQPIDEINNTLGYCLAIAAQRWNIGIIANVVMTNHHHTIVFDRDGMLPKFLEAFHGNVARALNRLQGRTENFWAAEQTCVTELVTAEDVLRMAAYVLTNPVKAHLVDEARQWPGLTTIDLCGRQRDFKRPDFYFRNSANQKSATQRALNKEPSNTHAASPSTVEQDGQNVESGNESHELASPSSKRRSRLPDVGALNVIAPPEEFRFGMVDDWRQMLAIQIQQVESHHREERRATGELLPSIHELRSVNIDRRPTPQRAKTARPSRWAPLDNVSGGRIRPALKCSDRRRLVEEARRLRYFRSAHRRCRQEFAKAVGPAKLTVVFPYGTWQMRVRYGLECLAA